MSHSPANEGEEAVTHLNRRVQALKMRVSYQTWMECFKEPFTYEPLSYQVLGLEDDYVLYFGTGPAASTLKVPVAFLCSISKPLHDDITRQLRNPQTMLIFEKSVAFPFWWLMNFLSNYCIMPNAEGLAALLQMAHKFDIEPIAHMSRMYLSTVLNLKSFPHMLNAAVETKDEEFLAQCSCMVAAWSDELLSSPHISVLSFKAMLHLLEDDNLSPSSELVVFNAIVNWSRNQEGRSSPTELNQCLKKVRFLLFTEDQFQQEVLPSGLFPIKEANVMIRILRHASESEHDALSLVDDPKVQRTPRPVVPRTLVVGKQLHENGDRYLTYEATSSKEERPVCFFKVDKPVLLRRIISTSFLDEKGGRLQLEERDGFRVNGLWKHCSCTFEKPLPLQPKVSYHLMYASDTGRAEKEVCVPFEECVGDVTFKGMLFCPHFSLEFATFQAADPATSEKVWASMKPTDNEEVMLHQLATLDRLIRFQDFEEMNRRALREQREKLKDRQDQNRKESAAEPEQLQYLENQNLEASEGEPGIHQDPEDQNVGASATEPESGANGNDAGRNYDIGVLSRTGAEHMPVDQLMQEIANDLAEAMLEEYP